MGLVKELHVLPGLKYGEDLGWVELKTSREVLKGYSGEAHTLLTVMRSELMGWPADWMTRDGELSTGTLLPNIAYGMIAELNGMRAGLENFKRKEVVGRLGLVLESLRKLDRYRNAGFFPTALMLDEPKVDPELPVGIAAIDNAHIFLALLAVGEALPQLAGEALSLREGMDFSFFLDESCGLLRGVFKPDQGFEEYHNGALMSETRLADYIYMIQSGDWKHYSRLYRQIPDWCRTKNARGNKFHWEPMRIDSNGANLFEWFQPWTWFPEEVWGDKEWRASQKNFVKAEMAYGEQFLGGVWGHGPGDLPGLPEKERKYVVGGIPELAANADHVYGEVISPYASMFAARLFPDEVAANLNLIRQRFPRAYVLGLGFVDSVLPKTGEVASRFLSSNVGMVVAAMGNGLNGQWELVSDFFGLLPEVLAEEERV